MVRRAGHTLGFRNLFRGTPQLGAAKVVDLGYVYEDRNTLASARDNGNPTVRQQAVEVQYKTTPCNEYGTLLGCVTFSLGLVQFDSVCII